MNKKVTILIPCYNEEEGIGLTIQGIPHQRLRAFGYDTEVIVIDNNSTDRTAHIAEKYGAKVIRETRQGKGYAIQTGFKSVSFDTDIVVMVDGDDTYKLKEILRVIEPIDSGFCDVVIGTRLGGKIHDGAMSRFNRLGNWLFTFLSRVAFKSNGTDACSGYFAWDKKVIDRMLPHLASGDFRIEMEMIAKMAKMGFEIYSVPITYEPREGQSALNPVKDGIRIIKTWFDHLTWDEEEMRIVQRLPLVKHLFRTKF